MNQQSLHFEFNEAWILAPETQDESDETLMRSKAKSIASPASTEKKRRAQNHLALGGRAF